MGQARGQRRTPNRHSGGSARRPMPPVRDIFPLSEAAQRGGAAMTADTTDAIEGSQIVAQTLQEQGANAIFTVVGGPVIETVGACGDLGIRPIGVRHEQAAVLMAQAYQYCGGGPGVAILASGPAVTNGITGVHVAYDNCWPVLVLGGSSTSRMRGRGAFQEADSVAMMRPVCKWAGQADSAARLPELIAL